MININEESVQVLRRNKKIVGFVHTNTDGVSEERIPVFFNGTKMTENDIVELFKVDNIEK
jgi:hypothetical protein